MSKVLNAKEAFDKLAEVFPETQIMCLAFKYQPEKPIIVMSFKRTADSTGCFLFTEGKTSPTYAEVYGTGMDLRFDALQLAMTDVVENYADEIGSAEITNVYKTVTEIVDTNSLNVAFNRAGLVKTSFEI